MPDTLNTSYLANYKPPRLQFAASDALPVPLRPIWAALRTEKSRLALRRGYKSLREDELTDDARAALLAAIATAEAENGVAGIAKQLAFESLALCKQQWMAHRVLLDLYVAEKDYETACRLLETIELPTSVSAWDEPLSETDQHLLRAACAWMTQDWDSAADLTTKAYPKGVRTMPSFLQEDWLRLALYRERPEDAAEAARNLIVGSAPERADILLQTLVQQGWHKEALALYRLIFSMQPGSELLRRRMVGLCIREGELQEARRLMEQGALRLAV
jgi:hypothetical protein